MDQNLLLSKPNSPIAVSQYSQLSIRTCFYRSKTTIKDTI